MPCWYPVKGFRARVANPNGRRPLVFSKRDGYEDLPVTVPCGRCSGCRLERSRQWAVRCMHEAQLHEDNCYITLTYRDADLPKDWSLDHRDWQLFMKRFRRSVGPGVKFFMCGEYGEVNLRPHFHAIIFNYDFPDRRFFKMHNGNPLFTSKLLDAFWGLGYCTIGNVTFESAAYVARYVMKKRTGPEAASHYDHRTPEYCCMSRGGRDGRGIAFEWWQQFRGDVQPDDAVVMNGVECKPPKYYDALYEAEAAKEFRRVKGARKRRARDNQDDATPERLRVREKVQDARLTLLKRNL